MIRKLLVFVMILIYGLLYGCGGEQKIEKLETDSIKNISNDGIKLNSDSNHIRMKVEKPTSIVGTDPTANF